MTSNRPYRRALSDETALTELQTFSGKQFDPEVVKLMNAAAAELEIARQESTETPRALRGLAEAVQ
jgi:HD-GYP domain-containing protein (c-di-GMP phosphodiesterase class II)